MERRLFIATILSFIILITWARFNPFYTLKQKAINEINSQVIENKEITENSQKNDKNPNTDNLDPLVNQTISKIENDKIIVTISNHGAKILNISLKKDHTSLPITGIDSFDLFADANFNLTNLKKDSLIYTYENENYQITKSYTCNENNFLISTKTKIFFKNILSRIKSLDIEAFRLDISSLDKKILGSNEKSLLEYAISTPGKIFRKGNAFKFSDKDKKIQNEAVRWFSFRDRYYCFIYKPLFSTQMYENLLTGSDVLVFKTKTTEFDNQTLELAAKIYFGPQEISELAKADSDFPNIMSFSGLGIINFVATSMYKLMHLLFKVIHNWGLCIIITALLIYWGMYPLSIKGLMSMKRMQALQPEISKIREQYKNNPQKLQKETMELYKEYKINPLGGCLPLFFQMPFFIGVYQVLWRSVSFKGANFLWIKDLSLPDRLFILPISLPLIGQNINILPISMIIIMFFQQKFSSNSISSADPTQQQTQKMMMFMFPVMIGFIFYNIASGLALYFTIFYLMSTLTQWKMSKITKVF